MPVQSTDKKVTCSCLRAELGIFFLPMEDVLKGLYKAYPEVDFLTVTREQFPVYYRTATNSLIRRSAQYLALAPAEKARIKVWMKTRCTMCSYTVLRHIHQMHENVPEAA